MKSLLETIHLNETYGKEVWIEVVSGLELVLLGIGQRQIQQISCRK